MRALSLVLVVLLSIPFVGKGGGKSHKRVKVTGVVTAYCPCCRCCGKWAKHGLTKTGTSAHQAGIAVNTRFIPLGSTISVPGYGRAPGDDTGSFQRSSRLGHRIADVRFFGPGAHQKALEWGTKKLTISYEYDETE